LYRYLAAEKPKPAAAKPAAAAKKAAANGQGMMNFFKKA
jgi:hypothetical protein